MAKMLRVERCQDCPDFATYGSKCCHAAFGLEKPRVTNPGIFPDWCPLEDAASPTCIQALEGKVESLEALLEYEPLTVHVAWMPPESYIFAAYGHITSEALCQIEAELNNPECVLSDCGFGNMCDLEVMCRWESSTSENPGYWDLSAELLKEGTPEEKTDDHM